MTDATCGIEDNGGGRCRRSDSIDELKRELADERKERRGGERQILEGIGVLTGEVAELTRRVGEPPNPNEGFEGTGLQRAVYRTANDAIRDRYPSLDYGEGDITKVQDRPALVVRTKTAERRAVSLEEENAALKATLDERNRQSERAMARGQLQVARWKVTAGVILGVVAALAAIGQAVASAVGG